MMSPSVLAITKKELLCLKNDIHGLALLLMMPLTFLVIMSFALQKPFAAQQGSAAMAVFVNNKGDSKESLQFIKELSSLTWLSFVDERHAQVNIIVPASFGGTLFSTDTPVGSQLQLDATESVSPNELALVHAVIMQALGKMLVAEIFSGTGENNFLADKLTYTEALSKRLAIQKYQPSALIHSLAAWLVFGLFFVAIPLSTTFIQEKQSSCLMRLKSLGVTPTEIILGKALPFALVNIAQAIFIILIGLYLIPLLGLPSVAMAEPLVLLKALPWLALTLLPIICCALSYAFLVASIASTAEQATILGAAGIIILSAIGGIMVPEFVMPEAMQNIAQWSPMNWAMNNLLAVFTGTIDVTLFYRRIVYMLMFSAVISVLAVWRLRLHMQA